MLALSVTLNAKVPQAPVTQGKLTGMVLDPAKVYLPGAKVTVKGRRVRRELYSGDDGSYSIELPSGVYVVRFAHVGFYPVRKRVRVQSNGVTRLRWLFVCVAHSRKHG
jgi:hypothetical protein